MKKEEETLKKKYTPWRGMTKIMFLGRKPKKAADFTVLISTLILIVIGAIMVFSSSWPTGLSAEHGDAHYFLKRHLIYIVIGLIGMVIAMNIDYKLWRKHSKWLFGASVFLGLLVLITPLGVENHGATRWIEILGIQFMPSDIIKITSIMYFSRFLFEKRKLIPNSFQGTIYGGIIIVFAIITVVSEDLGTALIILLTLGTMFFIGGLRVLEAFIISLPFLGAALMFARKGFRGARLTSFMDPFKYADKEGFQVVQSLYAIGSGGLFGVGLGKSRQKFFYLSQSYNDFIFAIIAEELGLFRSVGILLIYAVLIFSGYSIARRTKDLYGKYLAVGITSLIMIQTLINIGVVTSSIPTTGVTLPFISYGGTSLVIMMASIGILLNISRYIDIE